MTALTSYKAFNMMEGQRGRTQKTLFTSGSGALAGDAGLKEETDITLSPLISSNFFIEQGDGKYGLALQSGFVSGSTFGTQTMTLSGTGSVTHDASTGPFSFPSGGTTSLPSNWTYTEPSVPNSNSFNSFGSFRNNTGEDLPLSGMTFSIVVNFSAEPEPSNPVIQIYNNSTRIMRLTSTGGGPSVGDNTFGNILEDNRASATLESGGELRFGMSETREANDDFTYSIKSLTINIPGVNNSTTYTVDMDTEGSVFTGTVTGTLSNDLNITAATSEIKTAIKNTYTSITDEPGDSRVLNTNQTAELSPSIAFAGGGSNISGLWFDRFNGPSTFRLTLDSSQSSSPITGSFSSLSDGNSRAAQLRTKVNAAGTTGLTVKSGSNNVVELDSTTFGVKDTMVYVDSIGLFGSGTVTVQVTGRGPAVATATISGGGLSGSYSASTTTSDTSITASELLSGFASYVNSDSGASQSSAGTGKILVTSSNEQLYDKMEVVYSGDIISNTLDATAVTEQQGDTL